MVMPNISREAFKKESHEQGNNNRQQVPQDALLKK